MAWRTIPDTEIDQDSPVTQQLMTALRDNPIAIANGLATAGTTVVSGIMELVEVNQVASNTSTVTMTTDLSAYRDIRLILAAELERAGVDDPLMTVQIRQTSGTWRTVRTFSLTAANVTCIDMITIINLQNADGSGITPIFCVGGRELGTLDITSNAEAIGDSDSELEFRLLSYGESYAEMRITCTNGDITGGGDDASTFWLYGTVGLTRDATA